MVSFLEFELSFLNFFLTFPISIEYTLYRTRKNLHIWKKINIINQIGFWKTLLYWTFLKKHCTKLYFSIIFLCQNEFSFLVSSFTIFQIPIHAKYFERILISTKKDEKCDNDFFLKVKMVGVGHWWLTCISKIKCHFQKFVPFVPLYYQAENSKLAREF